MSGNTRAQAAKVLAPVIRGKGSLNMNSDSGQDMALLRELCYGSLRLYPRLNLFLNKLLQRPFKDRDADIHALLILGLYQLFHMRVPDHAVLDQSVEAASALKKRWAKGLVNAVLRNALRQRDELHKSLQEIPEYTSAHPTWLATKIRNHWPDAANAIFDAGNERPPMVLRVNCQQTNVDAYLTELDAAEIIGSPLEATPSGIRLEQPVPVSALPGFEDGRCSVQDEAAQWAAEILAPEVGQSVLDACAAPGGKTGHLLERSANIRLTAIELDQLRIESIRSNLNRLKLDANIVCADATDTNSWWDGTHFQRILIDAPCSGTGVIRRHPDIKLLRRPSDLVSFAKQQSELLDTLWPLLAEDGLLLYVTCSIMPSENEEQMQAFLKKHSDAVAQPLNRHCGLQLEAGQQCLPTVNGPDGFYFSLIRKFR